MAPRAPDWEKKLRAEIGKRLPKMDFDDTEFSSVITFLREISGMAINPDWTALEAAGVKKTSKVSIHTNNLTLEQNLNLICQMLRLQYRLTEDEVLVIEKFKPAKTSIKVGPN